VFCTPIALALLFSEYAFDIISIESSRCRAKSRAVSVLGCAAGFRVGVFPAALERSHPCRVQGGPAASSSVRHLWVGGIPMARAFSLCFEMQSVPASRIFSALFWMHFMPAA